MITVAGTRNDQVDLKIKMACKAAFIFSIITLMSWLIIYSILKKAKSFHSLNQFFFFRDVI